MTDVKKPYNNSNCCSLTGVVVVVVLSNISSNIP